MAHSKNYAAGAQGLYEAKDDVREEEETLIVAPCRVSKPIPVRNTLCGLCALKP